MLVISRASAADTTNVLVVRTRSDAAVSGRMIAELAALGFDVVEVADDDAERPLTELGRNAGAVAAVRAVPGAAQVELWVVDPTTRATAFEETVSIDTPHRPDLLAVRAVEILRARLVRVGLAQPRAAPPAPVERTPPPPPPRPPPPPPVEAPRDPVLWFSVGPALQISAGGVSPVPSALLALRATPSQRGSLFGFVTLPLTSARVSSSEGFADLEPGLAGLAGQLQTAGDRWSLALGAGMGALWVDMVGDRASREYVGRTTRVTTLAGFGDVTLCRRILDGVGVCSDLWFGSSMPRVVVRFVEHDVATWGRPFGVVALRAEIAVPGLTR